MAVIKLRFLILAFVVLYGSIYALLPSTCDTDAECRVTRQCMLTPGCDGGPDPAHQPWRWLP